MTTRTEELIEEIEKIVKKKLNNLEYFLITELVTRHSSQNRLDREKEIIEMIENRKNNVVEGITKFGFPKATVKAFENDYNELISKIKDESM